MKTYRFFPLKNLNTLKIQSYSSILFWIENKYEVALLAKKYPPHKFLKLGGGSNILLTKNITAPILHLATRKIDCIAENPNYVWLKIAAGENWHHLVFQTIQMGYAGLENLALIPGTVGAAPIQNIGAYGKELSDVLEYIEVYDPIHQVYKRLSNDECLFGYRHSIFKDPKYRHLIVLEIVIKLSKNPYHVHTSYGRIKEYLSEYPKPHTARQVFQVVCDIRRNKLPMPDDYPNCGSFFKNPIVTEEKLQTLNTQYLNVPNYPQPKNKYKIPAAWLIEISGLKGYRINNVGTFPNQPLVIVQYGDATGAEVFKFSQFIQNQVYKKTGIYLEREVNVW